MRPDEFATLQAIMKEMSDLEQSRFISLYSTKRRDRNTMIILAAIGFLGVAGIHRFVVRDMLLGILYLLTVGFCYIGTIIDLVNIGNITQKYNIKQAYESAQLVRMVS